ncbi:hypothetical protein [Amycolatopsis sp. CA-230715]|uniref:hypothetical protein n=1 Tax=Amycolatopsis sp. CA-230715 TaxID=2745196 RepID=UPI001C031360|nr:hypothetical protein [Amycolatopsis sp. CA-230715]
MAALTYEHRVDFERRLTELRAALRRSSQRELVAMLSLFLEWATVSPTSLTRLEVADIEWALRKFEDEGPRSKEGATEEDSGPEVSGDDTVAVKVYLPRESRAASSTPLRPPSDDV